jgi:2-amino-4-ketopentanoate thiolase alpha subunit
MSQTKCSRGEWIEIGWTAFPAADRSRDIPEETQIVPMLARVKGFALSDGALGDAVSLKTVAGRVLTGELLAIRPNYTHSFGMPQPELLDIGLKLREGV